MIDHELGYISGFFAVMPLLLWEFSLDPLCCHKCVPVSKWPSIVNSE